MALGGSELRLWSWLNQLPFALRIPKDKPRWDGLLTGLCQTHIPGHCWEAQNGVFPLGPSVWVAHVSGLTCMEIGLAVGPRGGLITCVLAVCC